MENLISQICGNCHFSLAAHRAQKYTDPKTLQWAIQPAGRLLCQPSEWALCKHLVPETDCVTRISTFTYSKPHQSAAPLSGCNHNICLPHTGCHS